MVRGIVHISEYQLSCDLYLPPLPLPHSPSTSPSPLSPLPSPLPPSPLSPLPSPSPLSPPPPPLQGNEQLEQERLLQVQSLLNSYTDLLEASIPPIQEACQELVGAANEISVEADLEYACTNVGTGPNQPEQLLLDCYVS